MASLLIGWALNAHGRESRLPAPAVGFAVLLVVANLTVRLPGSGRTATAVVGLLVIAALGVMLRRRSAPAVRERLAVVAIVLVAVSLPFLANGRFGFLGLSESDDLSFHLVWADAIRAGTADQPQGVDSPGVPFFGDRTVLGSDSVLIPGYPVGVHSLAAVVATALPGDADAAFLGLLIALPVLIGLTALAALPELRPALRVVAASLTGVSYLTASYFVNGSFKELVMGLLVLAFALVLRDAIEAPRRSAVLGAVLAAATTFTYSYHGLVWPLGIVALWGLGELALRRPRVTRAALRELGLAAGLAFAVLAMATAPELGRFGDWAQSSVTVSFGGGATEAYARGAASGYAALGIWPSTDFRLQPANVLRAGMYVALALGAAAFAAGWWTWRRDVAVPAAVAVSFLVYERASVDLSPDFTAKTLAVAAPTVMLMTTRALLSDLPDPRSWLRAHRPSAWRVAQLVAAIVFVGLAAWSSALALRSAVVDPGDHDAELRELRPLVRGKRTLFLGKDFYAPWRLRGAELSTVIEYQLPSRIPLAVRPEKPVGAVTAFDFDSVPSEVLDRFSHVITTRTAFTSFPPRNWRAIRATRSFVLWQRRGSTPPRSVLVEGGAPGAVSRCRDEPFGRGRVRGRAGVLPTPVVGTPADWVNPAGVSAGLDPSGFTRVLLGTSVEQRVRLSPGRWDVSFQYQSPARLAVTGPGLSSRLPANLDPPGPFWSVGTITAEGGPTTISVTAERMSALARPKGASLGVIALTRTDVPERVIPLHQACGRYVDWYVR